MQNWSIAYDKINEIYNDEVDKVRYIFGLLNEFSSYAARGDIPCHAQHRLTLEVTEIGLHAWNADERTLWSRYVQGTINNAFPGNTSTEKDDIILVNLKKYENIISESGIDFVERRRIVADKLREYADKFPDMAPEGGLKYLVPNIARYLHIKRNESKNFIISVVGNTWHTRGRRGKEDIIASKNRRVIPDSAI